MKGKKGGKEVRQKDEKRQNDIKTKNMFTKAPCGPKGLKGKGI